MAEVKRTGNEIAKETINVARMIVLYIMGDFDVASIIVSKLDNDIVTRGTHFATTFILMYAALVMLAMARKTGKRRFQQRATFFKGVMQTFKKAGNLNIPPLLELVTAEQVSLRRNPQRDQVKKAYEIAVRMASQSGFTVVEAFGNERAGEYMQSIGDDFWAETFLSRAFLLYNEWGAKAKAKQMLETHSFLTRSDHLSSGCKNVSISLRKRYSYKAANEIRRLSLS